MISNGNYKRKELCSRENREGEYSPIADNIDQIIMDLLSFAAENPDLEQDWEPYSKTVAQDNYYFESANTNYLIQYDFVAEMLTLYELRPIEK